MALNVLRGRGNRRAGTPPEPLPIGETDGNIFNCPVCARPLAQGARRCPGCRTRLILGVAAGRAGAFLGTGLVAGFFIGGIVMTAVASMRPPTVSGGAPPASPSPAATESAPPPTPTPTRTPEPAAPAIARSALVQAAGVNAKLATAQDALETELARGDLDTSAVAAVLRSVASDAAFGVSLAPRIASWPDAAAHAADLEAFYDLLRDTAREALRASVRNEPAYRAGGQAMAEALAGLADLDARTRALASTAGVDLPPAP